MPLKKSEGNMYPWCTHTHSHLGGECPHRCSYCYVQAMNRRFKMARYTGPVRLIPDELTVNYGSGKTIFVDHMNDLFAKDVNPEWVGFILDHCRRHPGNTYVFQTKNPAGYHQWLDKIPKGSILGTTIESNKHYPEIMRDAPEPESRRLAMAELPDGFWRFVTIEPILDCHPAAFVAGLAKALRPQLDFVNIGADSKGTNLPEPTSDTVRTLIALLKEAGIEIRQKSNLARLLK